MYNGRAEDGEKSDIISTDNYADRRMGSFWILREFPSLVCVNREMEVVDLVYDPFVIQEYLTRDLRLNLPVYKNP